MKFNDIRKAVSRKVRNWLPIGGGLALVIFWFAAIIGLFYGYISNIVSLVDSVAGPINALFILRCVGIFFAPLGVVLGYF